MRSDATVQWRHEAWHGELMLDTTVVPGRLLAAAAHGTGRVSRHAWTRPLDGPDRGLWLKVYPAPDGRRAWRAWRMAHALATAGFAVPEGVLIARRRREGVPITRDVGGHALLEVVAASRGAAKHELLRALGRAVAALHMSGFVHGDLVPSNVRVREGAFVLLDHDRTRRSRFLVWWGGRRNLVQLGRFVVPGLTIVDRARVLFAYADRRGLSYRARHRLAWWAVRQTIARRVAVDHLTPETASRAGFTTLMRSGGPFDPAGIAERS